MDHHQAETFNQSRYRIEQIQAPEPLRYGLQGIHNRNGEHPHLEQKGHGQPNIAKADLQCREE